MFDDHENVGMVWAEYAGGRVIRGFLVGTRVVDGLSFPTLAARSAQIRGLLGRAGDLSR